MYVGCIDAAAHQSIRKPWAHLKLMLRFSALDLCVRNYGLCHDYRDLVPVVTAFVRIVQFYCCYALSLSFSNNSYNYEDYEDDYSSDGSVWSGSSVLRMKTALVLHYSYSTSTIFVTEHSGNATGYDYYNFSLQPSSVAVWHKPNHEHYCLQQSVFTAVYDVHPVISQFFHRHYSACYCCWLLPCVEERRKCLSSSVATKAIAAAALLCLLLADRGRGAGSSAASFVAREESLGSPEKLRGLD